MGGPSGPTLLGSNRGAASGSKRIGAEAPATHAFVGRIHRASLVAQPKLPVGQRVTRAAHPATPLRTAAALPPAANAPGRRTPPASRRRSPSPRRGRVRDTSPVSP
ncbi:DUF6053 domain-containing protein [Lysobacter enzymogenes]|uniref:DUF6053 domain-containing protein n=1 Tax=Lysobacter enzymogenes TaxID=69 RepID=UPI003747AAA4